MNKHAEAQQLYLKGYQAFERGDYSSTDELSGRCLALSSPKSYWHSGSLGLKCWTANFSNKLAAVESTANTLLSLDTGDDKAWFDGLALLNLGLAKQRSGIAVVNLKAPSSALLSDTQLNSCTQDSLENGSLSSTISAPCADGQQLEKLVNGADISIISANG